MGMTSTGRKEPRADTQSRRSRRLREESSVEAFDEIPLNGMDEAGNIYLNCLVRLPVTDRVNEVRVENNSFIKSKPE
jgi:hypothetical protein